jgi:hypothetical protein
MPWTKCGTSYPPGHQVFILIAFYTMLGHSAAIHIPVYRLGLNQVDVIQKILKNILFSLKFISHYTFPMAYNRHPL